MVALDTLVKVSRHKTEVVTAARRIFQQLCRTVLPQNTLECLCQTPHRLDTEMVKQDIRIFTKITTCKLSLTR